MDKELRDYIQSVKNFHGSVLVARQGEILLKDGFGYANPDKQIKNTSKTNFGIGSITKSFTALAIMQLVEKGKIRLSDFIEAYIPNVYPDAKITIHHLLSHTSGIRNHLYVKEMQTGEAFSPSQIIDAMSTKPLKFSPGKGWLYSNTNYVLLGQIIEKISGQSYHDYIKENILRKAGMNHTYFDGDKDNTIAHHGTSVFDCHPSIVYAAGDILSNVEDLHLYDQALDTEALVSKESLEKMWEIAHKGRLIKYGYGWFLKTIFGQRSVSHGGFHPIGYTSHLEKFIDDKVTIIVLSNNLQKYSPLGIKYFGATDVSRELSSRIYNSKVWFWQKMS